MTTNKDDMLSSVLTADGGEEVGFEEFSLRADPLGADLGNGSTKSPEEDLHSLRTKSRANARLHRNANRKLNEIPLDIEVVLGRRTMPIAHLMTLSEGEIIKLERRFGEPLEIKAQGRLIAFGEIVADDRDNFVGIRIVSTHQG